MKNEVKIDLTKIDFIHTSTLTKDFLKSEEFGTYYKNLLEVSKVLDNLKKLLKDSLYNIEGFSVENPYFTFKVSEPTVAQVLDSAKLKEHYADVYKACLKEQSKDGSFTAKKKY